MAKVGPFSIAMTVNLGDYQSARYEVGIHEVDTDLPLEPQLAAVGAVYAHVMPVLEQQLYEKISGSQLVTWVKTGAMKR
jgi:hypothetical protein